MRSAHYLVQVHLLLGPLIPHVFFSHHPVTVLPLAGVNRTAVIGGDLVLALLAVVRLSVDGRAKYEHNRLERGNVAKAWSTSARLLGVRKVAQGGRSVPPFFDCSGLKTHIHRPTCEALRNFPSKMAELRIRAGP